MLCPLCAQTPKGIDGHIDLVRDPNDSKKAVVFHCAVCQQRYSRQYEGNGMFGWIRVPEAQTH